MGGSTCSARGFRYLRTAKSSDNIPCLAWIANMPFGNTVRPHRGYAGRQCPSTTCVSDQMVWFDDDEDRQDSSSWLSFSVAETGTVAVRISKAAAIGKNSRSLLSESAGLASQYATDR
jgi:hypothetical protein